MKRDRQAAILRIIREKDIGTQEELAELLRGTGFSVTQATVSRDIRELYLTKVTAGTDRQKYVVMRDNGPGAEEKSIRVLKEGLESVETAQNLVVVRTGVGMAMAVAAAIDALHIDDILGCVAGDDAVLIATKEAAIAEQVRRRIREFIYTT